MISKTEELVRWASKLLQADDGGAGGGVDPDEFERFRAASLALIDLLFDQTNSRYQMLAGQAGRPSREAMREDLALLQAVHGELLYFRDLGH
jgi:hypothetical protein